MKSLFRWGVWLAALGTGSVASVAAQTEGQTSLVVMVVVDQLRGDLIDRYEPVFTGGIRHSSTRDTASRRRPTHTR